MPDIPTKDGYSIDPSAIDLAIHNLSQAEEMIFKLVDDIRTEVIVEGLNTWEDPYGEKLIGTIDAITTGLDQTLQTILNNEVALKKACNELLAGTDSPYRYNETPSLQQ